MAATLTDLADFNFTNGDAYGTDSLGRAGLVAGGNGLFYGTTILSGSNSVKITLKHCLGKDLRFSGDVY